MFMARAVRVGGPLGKAGHPAWYVRVPQLSQMAHAYGKFFPDRLTRFQPSSVRYVTEIGNDLTSSPQRHELRHDAESTFWLLLWWVITATPADGDATEIPSEFWVPLVGTAEDARSLNIPTTCLDPAYAPLSELLGQLADALEYDLYWATDTHYTHPEFLHEVFQRHILNFIFENMEKEFMNLTKADAARKPTKVTTVPSLSTPQILSLRAHSKGSKHSRDSEPHSVSWLFFISCL